MSTESSTALVLWTKPKFVSKKTHRRHVRQERCRDFLSILPQPLSLVRWSFRDLNRITRKVSAFASFRDLLDADGGYFPSLGSNSRKDVPQLLILADAYDAAQQERGDARRAFRWGMLAGKGGVS